MPGYYIIVQDQSGAIVLSIRCPIGVLSNAIQLAAGMIDNHARAIDSVGQGCMIEVVRAQ